MNLLPNERVYRVLVYVLVMHIRCFDPLPRSGTNRSAHDHVAA